MRKNNRFIYIKIALIAAVPLVIHAYEFGPPPGSTGAPGDNKTGCIESGCHTGTANSGTGSVKISLPNGATTYTPGGPAIPITVLITDTTMKSYGFQLTARSGTAGTTQAGDFSTTDNNSQVMCPDGSAKANGKSCPASFPVQDIEHTTAGWSNSISTKGSFSYTFNWTPPATAVGNVTMYVAANCGTGTASVTPTKVYLSSLVLAPGAATGPSVSIANVLDAASFKSAVVPGEWVAIFGSGFGTTTRTWATADFNNGNNLPSSLDGVSVKFGTLPASVFFISPGQIDAQAPAGISGTVPVTVSVNGTTSTSFTATVAQNAPSLFTYPSGANTFAAAQNGSFVTLGDPAVTPGTAKAVPGQAVILYINGLGSSPSGTLISPPINYAGTVTVTIGTSPATVTFAGLVAAGLYQVNAVVPTGLAAGNYPITVSTSGQTSPSGVLLPVGP